MENKAGFAEAIQLYWSEEKSIVHETIKFFEKNSSKEIGEHMTKTLIAYSNHDSADNIDELIFFLN